MFNFPLKEWLGCRADVSKCYIVVRYFLCVCWKPNKTRNRYGRKFSQRWFDDPLVYQSHGPSKIFKFCTMNRWIGKCAVVTGASSGIGARITIDLVNAGMIVVGLARRVERVEELKANILTTTTGELHALRCDVTKEEDVLAAFGWIEDKFGGVDVLVNNAGVLRTTRITTKGNTQAIRDVIDTNIFAVPVDAKS